MLYRRKTFTAASIALIVLSALLLVFSRPCHAAVEQYFYIPTYYSSVDEAFAAIRNMQNQFVGWQGSPVQRIELDRFGLRITDAQELTIFPFDRLVDLQLNHYPDLNKEYKWGVVGLLKGSNDPAALRTPTWELAAILYNAISSLSSASGHPVSFARIGASFRDIISGDLESKAMKEIGLTDTKGMVVVYVQEQSPAKTGGMVAGDVIVACNDIPVINYDQWASEIWPTAKTITFKVLQKGGTTTRYVDPFPVDKLPQPPASLTFQTSPPSTSPSPAEGQKPPKLGFSLRMPNTSENQALKGKPGAVISTIAPGGLAEAAKLQVGDILMACNGKPIQGPDGLGSLLASKENTFTVMRKGTVLTVKLAPEVSY
jgi:hypothetical protein